MLMDLYYFEYKKISDFIGTLTRGRRERSSLQKTTNTFISNNTIRKPPMSFQTTNIIFDLDKNHQQMLTPLSEVFILQTNVM